MGMMAKSIDVDVDKVLIFIHRCLNQLVQRYLSKFGIIDTA